MEFPEIWRYDGETLTVLLLDPQGRYTPSDRSASLAFLPMGDFLDRLHEYMIGDDLAWRRNFRVWVREVLAPLRRRGEAGAG